MEELTIKHGPFVVVRRIIGILNLICAIAWLLAHLGSLRFFDWIFFTAFMVSGGSLLTFGFGTEKSYIKTGEGFLKIKWMNKLRPIIIGDTIIDKITMTRFKVIIERKENRPLILRLDFLEEKQKKEIYDYFIEYTSKMNLVLIRDF